MRRERVNTLVVRTPEGVSFSHELASPVTRAAAWFIDIAVVGLVMTLVVWLALALRWISAEVFEALLILLMFLVPVGYAMLLEWSWKGRTLGKKVVGLRVIDEEGLPLRFQQVMMRNLLRVVDSLPVVYLVGGLAAFLNRRNQRLGDLAAGTVVVRVRRPSQPDVAQLLAGKFNSLRGHPRLEARLRQEVTPAEAAVALRALLRRDELDPAARLKLFADLAAHFRELGSLPEELLEGMSDEQLVRNVVDVLYRARSNEKAGGQTPATIR